MANLWPYEAGVCVGDVLLLLTPIANEKNGRGIGWPTRIGPIRRLAEFDGHDTNGQIL